MPLVSKFWMNGHPSVTCSWPFCNAILRTTAKASANRVAITLRRMVKCVGSARHFKEHPLVNVGVFCGMSYRSREHWNCTTVLSQIASFTSENRSVVCPRGMPRRQTNVSSCTFWSTQLQMSSNSSASLESSYRCKGAVFKACVISLSLSLFVQIPDHYRRFR